MPREKVFGVFATFPSLGKYYFNALCSQHAQPAISRIPVKTILSSSTERDWAATEASRTMWGQGGSLVPRKPSKMPLWLRRNVEQIFSDSPSEDVPHGTFLADREVSADTSLGSDTPPNRSERLSGKSFGFIPQTIQRPHAATRPAESLLRGSTDVAGARPSIKRPRVNRTEAASKRGAPALRPSTGSFFLRGSVPSATAATSGTNEVGGVTCAASTSVVNRREGNPSVPNAATSSAKNTQRMLRESRKAEAAKDDSWTQWKTSTREKLPARRPEYDPKFFTTRVQGVEAASPLSPRPFKRKTSTTFFAQTERKDGRPVEDLASSSPRASSNAPGNSVGVRNGYDAKQKPAKTLEASALRPLPGVAPSSPRCLDVGSRRNRKEKRTRIASAEASPGHRSEEVALFQQLVAQLRRDLKSQRNLPPLLSRDARDVSRSQGLDMANEGLSKQKMAAAVLPAKRPRGRPSATFSGPIVPPVEGRLPDHPEGTAAPREDASTSSDSRFSELSGLGAQSRRKLVSGGEVDDPPTEKSLSVSPERIAHKRRVFTKQRRDVELLDGELRPVGKTAPVGLGLLVSTDHVTVGILRLLPSAVKGYSETRDHDTSAAKISGETWVALDSERGAGPLRTTSAKLPFDKKENRFLASGTPVYEKRGPKWCIASPGGPRRVQTYPGLGSTTRMPFSPDTGKPRTAIRGRANPHGSGSVETPLSKHLLSQTHRADNHRAYDDRAGGSAADNHQAYDDGAGDPAAGNHKAYVDGAGDSAGKNHQAYDDGGDPAAENHRVYDDGVCDYAESDPGAHSEGADDNGADNAFTTTLDDELASESDLAHFISQFCCTSFANTTLSAADAMIGIISYGIAASLNWSNMEGLLKLVNFLFGKDVLPGSKFLLRKIWSKLKKWMTKHHLFCKECGTNVVAGTQDGTPCPNCQAVISTKNFSQRNFFTMLNLKLQLEVLLADKGIAQELFRSLQKKNEKADNTMRDLTDGALYQKQTANSSWCDITLTMNTDGARVFHSSKSSQWPLQHVVNELPVHIRWGNVLLAALWFGAGHPDMVMFLNLSVNEINRIGKITWESGGHVMNSRVQIVCCCVDAPARAAVLNMEQFNGYYGCTWCLQKGT
ncbi:uncharacterized protein ISCGN_013947 [Ixodes scapularis]